MNEQNLNEKEQEVIKATEELAKGVKKVIDDMNREVDKTRDNVQNELMAVKQTATDVVFNGKDPQEANEKINESKERIVSNLDNKESELLALLEEQAKQIEALQKTVEELASKKTIREEVSDFVTDKINTMKSAIETAKQYVKDTFSEMKHTITETLESVAKTVTEYAKDTIDAFKDMKNTIEDNDKIFDDSTKGMTFEEKAQHYERKNDYLEAQVNERKSVESKGFLAKLFRGVANIEDQTQMQGNQTQADMNRIADGIKNEVVNPAKENMAQSMGRFVDFVSGSIAIARENVDKSVSDFKTNLASNVYQKLNSAIDKVETYAKDNNLELKEMPSQKHTFDKTEHDNAMANKISNPFDDHEFRSAENEDVEIAD